MPSTTEARELVQKFPDIFDQAVTDWAVYKVALKANTVPINVQQSVNKWYGDFPKLWAGIRPNWERDDAPEADKRFAESVNRWVIRLRGEPEFTGLGVAPLIILGILVAGAFGAVGVTWAIGYVQQQRNISRMITQVSAGKIPASVLEKAVAEEKKGLLAGVLGAGLPIGALALIIALVVVAPRVFKPSG